MDRGDLLQILYGIVMIVGLLIFLFLYIIGESHG